ncbi:MAG: YfcE family phosphodiesterase [Desulfatibacillaceae bacterium]|nr:YfcE family phosphodiesterase [Desulfatibacillaceae bacterium]
MTLIGVISDTHLAKPTRELASLVNPGSVFGDASFIIHCGDIMDLSVLEAFAPKRVVAVCGNMDGHAIANALPAKTVERVERIAIGIIHGWGPRENLEARILPEFAQLEVDAICYGHTHTPASHYREGILLFNPGSFMSGTVGLLEVDKGISGRIVRL